MGNATRIISNTFYLFLDWAALTLGGYFYWVIMGKTLSPAEVGRFSTIYNISMFLVSFASLGINIAITKLFPYYQENRQDRKIAGSLRWAAKVTSLSSIAFGSVLVFLNPVISRIVPITANDAAMAALMIFVTNLLYITNGYLYGTQKIKSIFLSDTVLSISKVLATLPLIVLGYSYLGPVYGFLIASLITLCVRYRLIPKGSGPVDKSRIWFYSVPILVSNIGAMLVNQGSIVILSVLSTASSVGLFSLVFFLSSPVRMIPQLISFGTFPVTSQQPDNKESVNRIFFHGTRYSLVLALPLLATVSIFSGQIILLLASGQYLDGAAIITPLAAAYLFVGLATVFVNTLYATGRINESRNASLIAGFVNLAASVLLIPKFGLPGASLAFLMCGLSMMLYSAAKIKTRLNLAFPLRDTLKIIVSVSVYAIFSYTASKFSGGGFWVAVVISGLGIYFLTLLAAKFFNETDIRMITYIKSKSPKFTHRVFDLVLGVISKFSN
ncbi:MAG: polysaccharide biosynthesis C-terminal domain-containing protein [Candidatus Aenigmarchaeota archaeon]|nr:polysaccharide biosynthesis C-terminal domain-containing protein [Candidatus Aenigmarchaeota archaeon]